jgi:hypothetical protein
MKKLHVVFGYLSIVFTVLLVAPQQASAVPAFARQTNQSCSACHFQNFPALNSFGRSFRSSGYTMSGGQDQVESEQLLIPATINASIIAKLSYQKTNGNTNKGTDYGSIQWPDEAAVLIGGQVAKDAGFLMELGLSGTPVKGNADSGTGEVTATNRAFLSTKVHLNVATRGNTQFSIIPFSTEGLGVGYGFELLNTGAQRSMRPIEEREGYSAAQTLGLGSGEATGVALVASRNDFFINVSPWVPGWGGSNTDVKPGGLANYLRAAYMPYIKGWDTGFGVQWWGGDATVSDGAGGKTALVVDGWVVDFQAQGEVAAMPLGIYASYGSAAGDPDSIFNTNTDNATAFGILGQLGIIPQTSVYLAYRTKDDGAATDNTFNAITYGANYLLAENIRLGIFGVSESGSGVDARTNGRDKKYIAQFFAGF